MLNAQIFAFADTVSALMLASGFLAAYLIDRKLAVFRWWAGFYALLALSFATVVFDPRSMPNWAEAIAWICLYAACSTAAFGMHHEGENTTRPHMAILTGAVLLGVIIVNLALRQADHASWALWGVVPSVALGLASVLNVLRQKTVKPVDWGYAAAVLAGASVIALRSMWFARAPFVLEAGMRPQPRPALDPAHAAEAAAASVTQPLILSLLTILVMAGLAAALVFRTSLKAVGQIRERSAIDAMTGLLTRSVFDERAGAALASSGAQPVCVIVADIDHFKRINDTGGHAAGDRVISALGADHPARRRTAGHRRTHRRRGIRRRSAPTATSPRRGCFAEAVRTRFAGCRSRRAITWTVTLSAGVAQRRADEPLHELMARADQALYVAKHLGRDRVMLAGASQPEPMTNPSAWSEQRA